MHEPEIYIGRGNESMYDEYLDFINLVFGFNGNDRDFFKLLPKLYKKEHKPCENSYVITENGRLQAAVGVFPREQQVGDETLTVHGIGNVAVHPRARSRGHMRKLMHMAVQDMIAAGVDYSDLGGRRQRYAYFSYEKVEPAYHFSIDQRNINYCFGTAPRREIVFHEIADATDSLLDSVCALYNEKPIRMRRPREAFLDIARSWSQKLYAILDPAKANECIGYCISEMRELALRDMADFDDVICAYVRQLGKGTLSVPIYDTEMIAAASRICEDTSMSDTGICTVFHFEKVVRAFLRVKAEHIPLPDGKLTVLVHGVAGDERFTITAENGAVRVEQTESEPDVILEHHEAMSFFFGTASAVRMRHVCASAWFPLPLFVPEADHV